MCGRYFLKLDPSLLEGQRILEKVKQYNIYDFQEGEVFPSQKALVLLPHENTYIPSVQKWGMPGYKGNLLINARSEGIHEKYTFRPLLQNRCVIVANGFYEWVKQGTKKDKICIQKQKRPLLYMAGIYNAQQEFVIVTGASYGNMAALHGRTPILMDEEQMLAYLHMQREFVVDNEELTFQKV